MPALVASERPGLGNSEDWHALVGRLGLGGVAAELARNCELDTWDGSRLALTLDPASQRLRVAVAEQRLKEALDNVLGQGVRLEIRVSQPVGETPSQRVAREQAERQAAAEAAVDSDPVVGTMKSELGARVIPGTVGPLDKGQEISE
jgi:DNA polymerase-3 subunit gamma/tau